LKLENILFESDHPNSLVKVIDFGLSAKYTQTHILKERVGTLYSMSPETMRGEYTSQADLWSIGVCAFMLLSNGQQPFEAKTPKQLVTKVLLAEYTFDDPVWENISDCAKDFISALLVSRPNDRLTAAEARKHPWMVSLGQDAATAVDETLKQRVGESMVRYAGKSDFLRLALNVIAKKSTSAEIFELRSVFDQFDTKNNGILDLSEFKTALSHLNCTDEDLESMFRKIVRSFVRLAFLVERSSQVLTGCVFLFAQI
jgi:calcium-dependent protein kinase